MQRIYAVKEMTLLFLILALRQGEVPTIQVVQTEAFSCSTISGCELHDEKYLCLQRQEVAACMDASNNMHKNYAAVPIQSTRGHCKQSCHLVGPLCFPLLLHLITYMSCLFSSELSLPLVRLELRDGPLPPVHNLFGRKRRRNTRGSSVCS